MLVMLTMTDADENIETKKINCGLWLKDYYQKKQLLEEVDRGEQKANIDYPSVLFLINLCGCSRKSSTIKT